MAVIEISGLRKEYRRRGRVQVAVDGLDLSVPEGGVFGFLGPNGSGKTTTIRCLLGLARRTSGTVSLLGVDSQRDLASVIHRVGAIVEQPAMFPTFTARRNLELLGALQGIGSQAVTAALDRVGLAHRADDLVRTYSLGMRQRLGLAAALLHDPDLLILDEPANGLDPQGIKEFRDLIRSLGREGRTVFVSSHLLSEIEQMCDRVAILARGKLLAQGEVRELLSQAAPGGHVLRAEPADRAQSVLTASGYDVSTTPQATEPSVDGRLTVRGGPGGTDASEITHVLADAGIYLSELRPVEVDLETVFLELTEGRTVESV